MRSVGESPGRGVLLLVIGLFLLALMGTVTWALLPSLLHPGKELADGSSFTGTAEQARMVLILFGLVLAFGLMAVLNGVYMIVTRRQSWAFIIGTLVLASLIVFSGFAFMWSET
jgi:magnesium-transporting ATPase (P-type)